MGLCIAFLPQPLQKPTDDHGRTVPAGGVGDLTLGLSKSFDLLNSLGMTGGPQAVGAFAPPAQVELVPGSIQHGPDRMQRLLRTAVWDTDAVAGDLRDFVVEHLGYRDGILVADETGYLKKGTHSVGVQRQYSGTAGRVENSQVGVFLAYVSPLGRALIDRRLYLPRAWSDDERRCEAAGLPNEVLFATKPELALAMVDAAIAAGVPAGWFTADEAYGLDPVLRAGLRKRGIAYVLAVACNTLVHTTPVQRERVDRVAALLPEQAWQTRSAGPGAKGHRLYDWAWITILDQDEGRHSLLVRRASDGQLAYYLAGRRCRSRWPGWSLSRVAGGLSRKRSRPRKGRSGSTSTSAGAGWPGTGSRSLP
jgi:hypothetical protein